MATLAQIAKAAGCSVMTVSNVLNGRTKESHPAAAKRAKRIRELAEKLDYRPNSAARAIVSGRFHNASMILGSSDQYLPIGMVQGAIRALADHGMTLSLAEMPDAKLTSREFMPRILRELSTDGLLINYITRIPAEMLDLIRTHRIPSVWMNTRQETDSVFHDDVAGARAAVQHLLSLGHRRIAYVGYADESHHSSPDRLNGYERAMRAAGLTPTPYLMTGRWKYHSGRADDRLEFCTALLAQKPRPTAVVAYEEDVAGPIVFAARHHGIEVPRDLSLITFHEGMVNVGGFWIATSLVQTELLARTAVDLLMRKLEGGGEPLPSAPVPLAPVAGPTVTPARN